MNDELMPLKTLGKPFVHQQSFVHRTRSIVNQNRYPSKFGMPFNSTVLQISGSALARSLRLFSGNTCLLGNCRISISPEISAGWICCTRPPRKSNDAGGNYIQINDFQLNRWYVPDWARAERNPANLARWYPPCLK
jgi:hypothetical protein